MGIALLHNYPQINNRLMILPNTAVISCSDDLLPCVVTNFVPVELVLVRTGWLKQTGSCSKDITTVTATNTIVE